MALHWARLLAASLTLATVSGCRVQTYQPGVESEEEREGTWGLHEDPQSFNTKIRFAYASNSIKPAKPIPLAGFGGIKRRLVPMDLDAKSNSTYQAPYKKVDIAPRVKVMLWQAFSDDGLPHVFSILSIDVVGVSRSFKEGILKALAREFPEAGMNMSNLQVVATHTHSGPAGLSEDPLFEALAGDRFNPEYYRFVEETIVETYQWAFNHLADVVSTTLKEPEVSGFNASRLDGMKVDKHLLFADLNTSNQRACFASFALHPTTFGQDDRTLSPDIGGHIENVFRGALDNSGCLFLPGAIGNATTKLSKRSRDEYATEMAAAVNDAGALFSQTGAIRFGFGGADVKLSQAEINLKGCEVEELKPWVDADLLANRAQETEVGLLVLGDSALVFIPGEMLYDASERLKEAVKNAQPLLRSVSVVSTANDYVGYLMTQKTYDKPSLESCSALFPASSAKKLQTAAVELVEKITF